MATFTEHSLTVSIDNLTFDQRRRELSSKMFVPRMPLSNASKPSRINTTVVVVVYHHSRRETHNMYGTGTEYERRLSWPKALRVGTERCVIRSRAMQELELHQSKPARH